MGARSPRTWFRRSSTDRARTRASSRAHAEADRLVATGQPVEAIGVLSEANRRHRDPGIELRLIELRFDAFRHASVPSPPPTWPDTIVDVFPGDRIPEIACDELTVERLRSGIFRHGALLVRGLLTAEQVDHLRRDIDRAFAAVDAHVAGEVPPDLEGWYEPCAHEPNRDRISKRQAGAELAVDSPPALFDLLEIFEAAGITGLARDHFGEPPTLLAKKTTLRKVRRDANTGAWHQDGAFMGVGIRSLNVWLALSHCGDDAPGLDLVGRRLDELAETGTDGAHATWSVGTHVAERVGEGTIVRPIFESGDALLFDHMMLHRTAVDPGMANDRYAIEAWLFAPSTYGVMTSNEPQVNPPRDQLPIWL